jgi:2-polyprenyl-3-methyl-5-hydroxy-6-metoxy-1,4-benzoquinol methylase
VTRHTATSEAVADHTYLLDNAAPQTENRFAALEACYDQATKAHLEALGLQAGWHCLEVGAGSGSIARWLAQRVGSNGRVLATDIDTRWLRTDGLAHLEMARYDVAAEPLPESAFDLIHERLVLGHLASRDAVVDRLVAALKPGGWLVLEEFDAVLPCCLDPLNEEEATFAKVGYAFVEALHRRGADTTWSRTLPHRLAAAGLIRVGATGHMTIYYGGSPEAQLQIANIEQVGDGLIEDGLITALERNIFRRLLDDPSFVGNHPLMLSTWGQRPTGAWD